MASKDSLPIVLAMITADAHQRLKRLQLATHSFKGGTSMPRSTIVNHRTIPLFALSSVPWDQISR